MAVDKKIEGSTTNGFLPAEEEAVSQMVQMQVEEGLGPDIEILEDGSAIVGEQHKLIKNYYQPVDQSTLKL